MTYGASLAKTAKAVGINASSSSYFSQPAEFLDPRLFDSANHFRTDVRDRIVDILFEFLATRFNNPHQWVDAWIAGSGVSYQWEAARYPGDLDCLVGVDYVAFRRSNSQYSGMGNDELASAFNELFANELTPTTANFMGAFELTFYVNPQSNIRDINPYAAYDIVHDTWTVEPQRGQVAPHMRSWEAAAHQDYSQAVTIIDRYSQALTEVQNASNPAHRVNAESRLRLAVDQAADFYENIHQGRKAAFSRTGAGYADWNNYRWQAGKQSGVVPTLRKLKDYRDEALRDSESQTYGMELPDARTLVRRSASRRTDY